MENEMQRRESEGLSVAFEEEDDDGTASPENGAAHRENTGDLIEGLDGSAQDDLEQLGAPLKHQEGLGISV